MEHRLKNEFISGAVMILAVLYLGAAQLEAVTFTSSLDSYSIVVGETVTLTLTIEDGSPSEISDLPQIDGLKMASTVSQGMRSSTGLDGKTTREITYTVALAATRAGEFVIPPFRAKVNGQTMSTSPLKLKVVAEDASTPPPEYANQPIFLWLVPLKEHLFIGEVIMLEMRLYVRNDIRRVGNIETPLAGDGFTFGKRVDGRQVQRRIGNNVFTMVPFFIALTPVKTGALTLSLADGSLIINPRDPFDAFGIFGPQPQRVPLMLQPLTLNVSPLPSDNVPASFTGAVGSYSLTVIAGPTNVAVGDPITVRVQISGRGVFDTITLPDQPAWRDFKAYPPTSKVATSDQLGMQGAKTFEQIVTPQNTNVHELPAFSFSYFDPDAGTYRTLMEPPVQLAVHSAGTTPAPIIAATKSAGSQAPPPQDILPIKEQLGALAPAGPPLLTRPAFLAAQSLPVLAWLAAFVWRKRTDSLANNPRLRRQRRVAMLVQGGLNDLRRQAAENNSAEFFATLFRLLQEQLGERLDCPSSSITEAVIDERLVLLGAPEPTLAGLRELFQLCNQARYAPMRTSGELAAVIPQFENAIRKLQKVNA